MKRVFIVLLFASFCFNHFAAKLKVLQDGNFREQPDGKSKVISIPTISINHQAFLGF